jgi:membrane protease YdiL (CAAX protease family)
MARFPFGSARQLGLAGGLAAVHAVAVPAGLVGASVLFNLEDPFRGGWASLAMVAAVSVVTVGGVVVAGLGKAARMSALALGWNLENVGRDVPLGLVGGLVAIATVAVTGIALGLGSLSSLWEAVASYGPLDRLVFAAIGVSAAITEESLFRGYLQPGLVKRLGPVAGILLGAAIFSVYHLNFGLASLLSKFALGALFGLLRHRTGSLVPGALAHASVWAVLGSA